MTSKASSQPLRTPPWDTNNKNLGWLIWVVEDPILTLPEANMFAPENGKLEEVPQEGRLYSGAIFLVLGRATLLVIFGYRDYSSSHGSGFHGALEDEFSPAVWGHFPLPCWKKWRNTLHMIWYAYVFWGPFPFDNANGCVFFASSLFWLAFVIKIGMLHYWMHGFRRSASQHMAASILHLRFRGAPHPRVSSPAPNIPWFLWHGAPGPL